MYKEEAVLVKPEEMKFVSAEEKAAKKGYGKECPVCYRPGKILNSGPEGNRYFCSFCNINWPE